MRTPQQAVEYAQNYLNTGYNGMCLAHVQDSYGAYARDPSAIDAWNASQHKHQTTDLASAPYGAPIYFSQNGNPYGHVAIHLSGDSMYTTDSGVGHPHVDSIGKWVNQYGYQPLGWTDDIEGQTIPQLGDDMAITTDEAKQIAAQVWSYQYDPKQQNCYNQLTYELPGMMRQLQATVTAQSAAIEALSQSMGADPQQIAQAVQQAVQAKLDSLEITITAQ